MDERNQKSSAYDQAFVNSMLESALRIGLLLVVLGASYSIISPFLMPVTWGIIIAVAAMPLVQRLEGPLRGRARAVTLVTLIGFTLIVVPSIMLLSSLLEPAEALVDVIRKGNLEIPPLPDSLATLPFVGAKLAEFWALATGNLQGLVVRFQPQFTAMAGYLLAGAGGALATIVILFVSVLIAAGFMIKAETASDTANRLATRLVGEQGEQWVALSAATIRSVLEGVVGVAVIQTIIITIGLIAMDIPAAGVWALLTLVLAIAQIPTSLIALPLILYVYSYADVTSATLFAAWTIMGSLSDNILKPILMGRGMDIPMPVILLGAIGGMVSWGIMGLFIGAVILALVYQMFFVWLEQSTSDSD